MVGNQWKPMENQRKQFKTITKTGGRSPRTRKSLGTTQETCRKAWGTSAVDKECQNIDFQNLK